MAGQYDDYRPIPAEDLPAKYAGCFKLLELSFTPPNDFDRVMTITGQSLQLITDGDDNGKRGKTLVMHAGYQKAIWELREGHLRYCPSQQRLWRRDPDIEDHPGERRLLNSWHPVKSIEDEYHIGERSNDRNRNYAVSSTIMREAKRAQWFRQVERGVRIDPCVWYRKDGHVVCIRGDTDMAVTQTFDPRNMGNQVVEQAKRICEWLTVDGKSCANLLRMFATPWLEPYKQLSFVLSGHGGDGKTLLLSNAVQRVLGDRKSFPAFKTTGYCDSGFSLNRESMNDMMAGMAFANAFLGVCHSMAHKLGAFHHLPHGIANALLIELVIRYNSAEVPTKMGTFPQYAYPHTKRRYAEFGEYLGFKGANDDETVENLIRNIHALKERVGIKNTIRDYGVDEEKFLATLDEMSEQAFDDQCTGANPRYPLISEIKEMYLKAYYGE